MARGKSLATTDQPRKSMVPCFRTIESPTLSAVSPLDSFPPLATRYCVLSLLMASRSLFDMEMRASVAAFSLSLVALQDILSPANKHALSAVRAMKSWGASA